MFETTIAIARRRTVVRSDVYFRRRGGGDRHRSTSTTFRRRSSRRHPLGDYNHNGIVDAADYTVWRDSSATSGSGLAADGNGDGMVTQLDYDIWSRPTLAKPSGVRAVPGSSEFHRSRAVDGDRVRARLRRGD